MLGSGQGKKILNDLVSVFMKKELFNSDPLKMARNVGQYDLVRYLQEMTESKDE